MYKLFPMRLRPEVSEELRRLYRDLREIVEERLREFEEVRRRGLPRVFEELCFCLLTPQSKARSADRAVRELKTRGLLYQGGWKPVSRVLEESGVRFYEAKARRIVKARRHLHSSFLGHILEVAERSPKAARELLVEQVEGLGYKEASHFLRNVGFKGLAILDRHILRTLNELGALEQIPRSLTRDRYIEIERLFFRVADALGIPGEALDLIMWARKTGEVFK